MTDGPFLVGGRRDRERLSGDPVRRRDVLRLLAAMGAMGVLAPEELLARKRSKTASRSHARKGGRKRPAAPVGRPGKQLVVLLLQGGPDGLSVAAPTADPFYPYLRPTTALSAAGEGLDMGDGFFLHPALAPLFPLWREKRLLVIPACGLPGTPTTHTEALAGFAAGTPRPGRSINTGWLGRLSLALGGRSAQMVVGSLSPVLRGAPHYKLISLGRRRRLPPLVDADAGLFSAAARLFGRRAPLAKAFVSGQRSRSRALRAYMIESHRAATGAVPSPVFAKAGERFGRELARRRNAALAFAALGGFDTHIGQGTATGYLADRLGETAKGLVGLTSGLGRTLADTVVVAFGEFGRSARENAFGGTDNGQGGVMLVLGGPVAGGRRIGRWPGLAEHRLVGGRDVAVTTDWRQVMAEIAVHHLGLPEKRLGDIFPGFTPDASPLGIVSASR